MKSISWKGDSYYLILPLTILIYYILILKGNVDNRIFVYDGLGNVFALLLFVSIFYFSIYNQSVRNKYILTISTSILILVIDEISTVLYTLILSTPTHIYIANGQSGVVYALWGFIFINSLNQIIHYRKITLGPAIVAFGIFITSAIPLMDPFLGFAIMKDIAYLVHIMAYFSGIIIGSVLQVLLFEDFGIYSKVNIFLNRGVMENE
jgi:hypothetical protein